MKTTVMYTVPVFHIPSEVLKSDELQHLVHSDLKTKQNQQPPSWLYLNLNYCLRSHTFEEKTIADMELKI